MRFVLASASPARLATLHAAGLRPDVVVSGVDESTVTAPDPAALVGRLAAAKADAVVGELPDAEDVLVLGGDSMLEVDGVALGKPADADEARHRWRQLAGHDAVLHTGHALRLLRGETVRSADATASTLVRFGRPTGPELEAYLASGEPLAVAGAFTIDGLGGWFVDGVDGDHHTVVGLSLPLLRRLLGDLGVSLLDLGWPGPAEVEHAV